MLLPVFLLAALFGFSSHAHELVCGGAFRAAAPIDSPKYRQYAPERQVDLLHLALDVTPNFRERSVTGTATLKFKVLNQTLNELRLNADDLRVSGIEAQPSAAGFQNTGQELLVYFDPPLGAGTEGELKVTYSAFPKYGLYFRTREMGYKAEDEHLFTQGEDIESRHWFPCFDHPNEKFTSEITCRVPAEMTVLSNGKLVSEQASEGGLKAVRWLQDKPHVTYLISLVAGYFKKIEDQYKDIHLAFYTPTSQIDYAKSSFAETKEMMAYFEQEIGVPYPWDKYYQVCVQDFMWGGMENTSISTLTDLTLFGEETENLRSSKGLVAHELVHQWFGDLVTCEDWSHIWLNEGFATYYANLYNLHKDGRDDFLYSLFGSARGFIHRSSLEDSRPIVFRRYDKPTELFGYLVYPKGGWVLHMLRSQLGEETFRRAVKTYLERHQYDTVVTHDLIRAVEEVSGRSFERFFDQWVFHPHHPELQVSYSWDEKMKLAKVSIAQVQQLTNDVALFHFPLTIRFKTKGAHLDRVVQIEKKQEDFFFPLDAAPEQIRLDPEYTLLAEINAQLPRPMLLAQLKDESDMMGRLFALMELGKSKDQETVQLMKERLNNDPFYGVRIEAAEALRVIRSEAALDALIASAEQNDARVRQKVVSALGHFYHERARDFALARVDQEKNPDIAGQLVRSLGAYSSEELKPALLKHLQSTSFQNVVADGAIDAIREQNDPSYIEPLLDVFRHRKHEFPARTYSQALDSLAYIARHETRKSQVTDFLAQETDDPRQTIRLGAIRALGTLRDDAAIPVLTRWVSGATDLPESGAANRSLEAVRAGRPVVNELQSLRSEVMELKRANDELKKSVDELKNKLDAKREPAASQPAKQEQPPAKKRTVLRKIGK